MALKYLGIHDPTKLEILWFFILFTVFSWVIGWYWYKKDLDRIEQQVGTERSVFITEIHKEIVKNREEL